MPVAADRHLHNRRPRMTESAWELLQQICKDQRRKQVDALTVIMEYYAHNHGYLAPDKRLD